MNSRLRISNQAEMTELVIQLAGNAAAVGIRALAVVFAPAENWLSDLATNLQCTYISADSDTDRADRISALLGSERTLAVVQLGNIPDLGLLAAAAGTLKSGGVLIVGTKARLTDSEYSATPLPQAETILKFSHSTRRLEQLAMDLANKFPHTLCCLDVIEEPSAESPGNELTEQNLENLLNALPALSDSAHTARMYAVAEQDRLLAQACKHMSANATSCIVITGHRGRGKSTLLARIALHLDRAKTDFYITAMHESALQSFNQHAGPAIAARFTSPEAAAANSIEILLIDEAASFSLKLLQHYVNNCRQLILCSTTEGYEASGRALDVRLLSDLSLSGKTLLHLSPETPWRWQPDDPLEQFTNQLLLKHNKAPPLQVILDRYENHRSAASNCLVRQITQHDLVSNENLLAQVYTLLSDTHYQTTTKDLEHLLDAPELQLWVQVLEGNVVGLLLLENEGQLPTSLHVAIVAKQRRLTNQLLPQLLAQMANETTALHKRFGRVVRLAVAPQLRRLGLASKLVNAVTRSQALSTNGIVTDAEHTFDAVGASFASDACSLAFWHSQGYTEFHRGFRANPRTGKHSAAVLRCFEPLTNQVLIQAVNIHQDNERARLDHLQGNAMPIVSTGISEHDARLLTRFADGQRSMNDTFAALLRLSHFTKLPMNRESQISPKQLDVLLREQVRKWLNER